MNIRGYPRIHPFISMLWVYCTCINQDVFTTVRSSNITKSVIAFHICLVKQCNSISQNARWYWRCQDEDVGHILSIMKTAINTAYDEIILSVWFVFLLMVKIPNSYTLKSVPWTNFNEGFALEKWWKYHDWYQSMSILCNLCHEYACSFVSRCPFLQ